MKKPPGRPKTPRRKLTLPGAKQRRRLQRAASLQRRLLDRLTGGATLSSRSRNHQGTGRRRAVKAPVEPRVLCDVQNTSGVPLVCTRTPCKCYLAPFLGRAVRVPQPDPDAAVRFGEVLKYTCSTEKYHVLLEGDVVEEEVMMSPEEVDRVLVPSGTVSRPFNINDPYKLPFGRRIIWVLDVFCGTKSVRRALRDILERSDLDYRVLHLDLDLGRAPDVGCDVRDWKKELVDKLGFREGDFDIIWISPECRRFSRAAHPDDEDIKRALELVICGRDIIDYFKPIAWLMENPRGRLREQEIMHDIEHLLLSLTYCHYHTLGLYKPTDIWTNVPGIVVDFCCRKTPCSWIKQGHSRHRRSAQRGPSPCGTPGCSIDAAQHVPHQLMVILMSAAVPFVCYSLKHIERRSGRGGASVKESAGRSWMRKSCIDERDEPELCVFI